MNFRCRGAGREILLSLQTPNVNEIVHGALIPRGLFLVKARANPSSQQSQYILLHHVIVFLLCCCPYHVSTSLIHAFAFELFLYDLCVAGIGIGNLPLRHTICTACTQHIQYKKHKCQATVMSFVSYYLCNLLPEQVVALQNIIVQCYVIVLFYHVMWWKCCHVIRLWIVVMIDYLGVILLPHCTCHVTVLSISVFRLSYHLAKLHHKSIVSLNCSNVPLCCSTPLAMDCWHVFSTSMGRLPLSSGGLIKLSINTSCCSVMSWCHPIVSRVEVLLLWVVVT